MVGDGAPNAQRNQRWGYAAHRGNTGLKRAASLKGHIGSEGTSLPRSGWQRWKSYPYHG